MVLQYIQEMDFLEHEIMDEASKAVAKATHGVGQDSDITADPRASEVSGTFVAYMDDNTQTQPPPPQKSNLTTSAKALDRWFAERKSNQGAPRLLEIPNEALITNAGPINLTGNITLVKEDGSITYANHISLCRCGGSRCRTADCVVATSGLATPRPRSRGALSSGRVDSSVRPMS